MSYCGDRNCSCSTGIHGGLTFGSGRLSSNGYWEFPCRICAKYHDDHLEEMIDHERQKLIQAGNFPLVIAVYLADLRDMDFIKLPAYPYHDTDLGKAHQDIKPELDENSENWKKFDELTRDW